MRGGNGVEGGHVFEEHGDVGSAAVRMLVDKAQIEDRLKDVAGRAQILKHHGGVSCLPIKDGHGRGADATLGGVEARRPSRLGEGARVPRGVLPRFGRHELADVVQRERAHLGERADAVVGVRAPGEDSGNGGHVSEGGIELSSRLIARSALEVEPAVTCGHARARRQQRLVHRAEMHALAATHESADDPLLKPGNPSQRIQYRSRGVFWRVFLGGL